MNHEKRILLIFILLISGCFSLFGQSTDTIQKEKLHRLSRQKKIEQGKPLIFPFAAPAYTPELGPTLIGVMMFSFMADPEDTLSQRSSIPVNLGISTRGSYFLNTIISTFWFEDKLRIFGALRFRNMPDHYWGVGHDNALNISEGSETTAYTRSMWMINPRILWQFKKHYFLGLSVDINQTAVRNVNPLMAADPNYLADGDRQFNSGLGLILRYDSRDVPVNPWKGMLADIQIIGYKDWFGSKNNFNVYQFDLRKFQQLGKPGRILALQFKTKITTGDVPFTDMAMLGSPYDLRGYYLGHYRDRSMILGIVEYRHFFHKKDGTQTKHGAVVWAGTGSIAPAPDQFTHWIPNVGFGYRFEVQPRMNVRAEIGFGKESRGFYISFNEAF